MSYGVYSPTGPRFSNKGILFDNSSTILNPLVSQPIVYRAEQIGITLHVLSTVAGTLHVEEFLQADDQTKPDLMPDASFYEFRTPIAIAANTPYFTDISGRPRPTRLRFVPGAGGAYQIIASIEGYGG